MDNTASRPPLSHGERIAAIREKAQRHVQRSARLFAPPPPEETDDSLLPVPSLLAVACTAALVNQAQAGAIYNEDDLNYMFMRSGNNNVSIELATDITLSNDLRQIPVTYGRFEVSDSISIDGQGYTLDGNGYRIFEGIKNLTDALTTLGDIKNIEIKNGAGNDLGGAIYAGNAGNISNSKFTNNQSHETGGALAFYEYGRGFFNKNGDGVISESIFERNSSRKGGAISIDEVKSNGLTGGTHIGSGIFYGDIQNSNFYENKASSVGGALHIHDFRGEIERSSFLGNSANGTGGAIYFPSIPERDFKFIGARNPIIINSKFIDNRAVNGIGGAIYSGHRAKMKELTIKDSKFLNNYSKELGAAIYFDTALSIEGSTLFYGNKSQNFGYNSIGAINASTLYVGNKNEEILMFDPIHSGDNSNSKLEVTSRGGNVFLGGANFADSFKQIHLTLTSVEYERGAGYIPAAITSNDVFASLSGSGTINAKTIAPSLISPSVWVNTGKRANEIDRNITDADIKAIGVKQDSIYGTLIFNGNVEARHTTYVVDVAWDSKGVPQSSDHVHVNGSWTSHFSSGGGIYSENNNVIRIDSINLPNLNITSDTLIEKSFQPITVLSTTGGIKEGFGTVDLSPSVSTGLPDYLSIVGEIDNSGNNYQLSLGLTWNSAWKNYHGTFTIPDGKNFTVNSALSGNKRGNAHWDGKSLTKRGMGTLILNGENEYNGGLTIIEEGTLILGDTLLHSNARIFNSVKVNNGAILSGFGSLQKYGYGNKILIDSGGVLAPGNDSSVGSLNTDMPLEFEKGSIFRVKALENGQSDKIIVRDQVNIHGGTVEVRGGSGSWGDVGKQRDYVIISKEGGGWGTQITGTFDNVTSDLAFLDPSLSYKTNEVNLHLVRNKTCFSGVGDCGSNPPVTPPPVTPPPVTPPPVTPPPVTPPPVTPPPVTPPPVTPPPVTPPPVTPPPVTPPPVTPPPVTPPPVTPPPVTPPPVTPPPVTPPPVTPPPVTPPPVTPPPVTPPPVTPPPVTPPPVTPPPVTPPPVTPPPVTPPPVTPPPVTPPPVNPPGISIGGGVFTWNQAQVGNALDALEAATAASGGHDLVNAALGLSWDAVAPAYDNVSGEIYPSTGEVLLHNSRQLRDAVYNRLRSGDSMAHAAPAPRAARTARAAPPPPEPQRTTHTARSAWPNTVTPANSPTPAARSNASRANVPVRSASPNANRAAQPTRNNGSQIVWPNAAAPVRANLGGGGGGGGLAADTASLWVSTWGHNGHLAGDDNAARSESSGQGVLVGIDNKDRVPDGAFHAGLLLGQQRSKVNIGHNRASRSEVQSYSAGVYGGGSVGALELRGGVLYSQADIETQRTINVAHVHEQANADWGGQQVQLFTEASGKIPLGARGHLAPYVGVAHVRQDLDQVKETGSVAALEVDKSSSTTTLATSGVRAHLNLGTGAVPMALYTDVGYQQVLSNDSDHGTKQRFVGQGHDFNIRGATLDENSLLAGVGLQLDTSRNSAVRLEYKGEFASGQKQHTGQLSWQVKF